MTTTPTQVEHPLRAALRTGAQTFVAGAAALTAITPIVTDFAEAYLPDTPPVTATIGVIVGGSAIVGGLATAVTRIMALEQVNAFLTRLGLGPQPKQQ